MAFPIAPDLADFIQALPKTETHLHIEGSLPWELLQKHDPENFSQPPPSYANDYKFNDFTHFEEQLLGHAFVWYTSPERYHEAAKAIFAKHAAANVVYVETSFASGVIEFLGLNGREVLAAILEAVPPGLEARIFLGIHHNGFTEKMLPVIEGALDWDGLAGIDLHGTETIPLDPVIPHIWREAREAGKFTKAHAGEFCGPDFVRHVIEQLGAQRIEHGIRSVEDPAVLDLIRRRNLTLDVCPISNHKLVPGVRLNNHPIRQLIDAGVKCTISTDDPLPFGNSLAEEYAALHDITGLSRAELARLCRNGLEAALVDEATRQTWLSRCDEVTANP